MTPLLALVKKDLLRLAVPLALWSAAGAYLACTQIMRVPPGSFLEKAQILSLIMFVALSVVTIAWTVQEDSARDPAAFWRSRPIPPLTLVGAKLVLLAGLLIAVPFVVILAGGLVSPGFFRRIDALPNVAGFLLCGTVACAALAACTRNVGEYLLAGVVAGAAAGNLGSFLEGYASLDQRTAFRLSSSQLTVCMGLLGVGGLITLIVQYRLRRLPLSIAVIALTLLAVALADAFWVWRIV